MGQDLELVDLELGQVLYEPGLELSHVIFPVTAIVSLLYLMRDGASAEIAVVGKDGLVGIALFMGGDTTPSRAVVQSSGQAYRFPAHALKAEVQRHCHAAPVFDVHAGIDHANGTDCRVQQEPLDKATTLQMASAQP